MQKFGDTRDWFFEKRYGLFIHWGIFSINGWHEQEQWRGEVPRAEYVKLAEQWNPETFDPDKWLDLAQEAGMEYVILTTKHHDGFCLFDTKYTDFNTMNTPYGKDIVAKFAEACHRRGMPMGLYYSVADWHQPNFPNRGRHHEIPEQPEDDINPAKYVEFMKNQVRELCTNYGKVHSFWWDMACHLITEEGGIDPSVNEMIRELQPQCVINNRGLTPGDMKTPERGWHDPQERSFTGPVEACNSVGIESWGYRKEESFYSDIHLCKAMATTFARGGNYLLNIGPKADGTIPEKSSALLLRLGNWLNKTKEAFYGTEPASEMTENQDIYLTRKDNTLYAVLSGNITTEDVLLRGITSLPYKATLLNTGEELRVSTDVVPSTFWEEHSFLRVCGLPVNEITNEVMVVKLEFREDIQTIIKKEEVDDTMIM